MTRMKNAELLAASAALEDLAEKELPVRVAFQLARLARAQAGPLEDLQSVQQKLVDRFTQRHADGRPVEGKDRDGNPQPGTVAVSDPAEFGREMETLLLTEMDLELPIHAWEDLANREIRIAPRTFHALGPVLQG